MSSTLKHGVSLLLAGAAACASSVGCARSQPREEKEPIPSVEPVATDEAMQIRDWSPSVAYLHSGTTQAWAMRWPYESHEINPRQLNVIVDPIMFIVQTVILPIEIITQPPGTRVNYAGQVINPTQTAVPPLPPEPAPREHRPPVVTAPLTSESQPVTEPTTESTTTSPAETQPESQPTTTEPATTPSAESQPAPSQPTTSETPSTTPAESQPSTPATSESQPASKPDPTPPADSKPAETPEQNK